ncbi:MAG: fasciclin domain-containing protein [Duncaniella sp.]|nr:fasciclin domain-containing protein [Duncaniella sp.]
MSRIKRSSLLVAVSLALCAGLTSCKDDDLASDDHYKAPSWLKGNAYEVMQKDGNHSIFLRAIDLSDYQEIVAGKSIVTVVAPTDEAFRNYLSKKGYGSIDELNEADHAYLNKLVAYHLMYYAFDWNKMVNFRPTNGDNATPDQLEVMAGYYYKHRTHAADPIEEQIVSIDGGAPAPIKIYHNELYIPVLSNKFFETKGIDAAYNYNYFYPDTQWGEATAAGTFNIANARVEGGAVVTDNGYLYNVDHVVEPLNTIYDEMALNPNYSKFLSIYDRYTVFESASDEIKQSLGYEVYVRSHNGLPNIAWEWPVSSWSAIATLEQAGYNVFAPSNSAIDEFFHNFWTQESGYTSVEDLDPLILQYFVMQSFGERAFIAFPEEIKNGDIKTVYGTPIDIDPDQVTDRKICANGAFYGMDHMEMPAIFTSVVGPAFKNTDFRWYLYALDKANATLSLAAQNTSFVTLIPKNEQLAAYEPAIQLATNPTGYELQQWNDEAGAFVTMGGSALKNITDVHVAQNIGELKTSGTQVISTQAPYNYWFVRDGKITTNALFNKQLILLDYTEDPFVAFTPVLNDGHKWSNGSAYSYDAPVIFEQTSGDGLGHYLAVGNDKNYKYYMFAQLLNKAGLITKDGQLDPTLSPAGCRFILFAPTNEAITQALADKTIPGASSLKVTNGTMSGTVSGTNKTNLANYLRQYFISSLMNPFADYPYVGSKCKGEFITMANDEKLSIYDDGTLSIGYPGKTPVKVNADFNYLPFAFSDGCLHFIDGIL